MVKDGLPPFHAPDAPIPVNRTLPECGHAQEGARNSMPFNNISEREIRSVAIGRRNWMFAGSDKGGIRAGTIYTLVETAKLNGLDPHAYLKDVLGRIADLLPWNIPPMSCA